MAFKPFRDERPMSQRPLEVQIEAEMFSLIRVFLSKKDQGKVMGAFREVISKVKVTPKHTVEVPWTWSENGLSADPEEGYRDMIKVTPLADSAHGPGGSVSVSGRALTNDELKTVYTSKEKQNKRSPSSKCLDDARKSLGKYPYNEGTNYLVGDGYFSRSCRDKYGDHMWDEACEIVRKER